MIPMFTTTGVLPAGIHTATLAEIEARFGVQSEIRRAQMESIRWMIDLAARAGVHRIVLNGSFVTDTIEPNDVDCVLLAPSDNASLRFIEEELEEGLPFLDIYLADNDEFDAFTNRVFAFDRDQQSKGMIEVAI